MTELMWFNVGLSTLNLILVSVLAVVYGRNWRTIRSRFTFALTMFAVFFAVHNAIILYHLLTMMTVFAALGEVLLLIENVLQAIALGFLLRATFE